MQLPPRNRIVQPSNRGTAIGILYSLVHILSQDADAQVLLLPSDHDVAHEEILERSLAAALAHVVRAPEQPVPELDFSRDLLEGREASLCVLPVPACGWSDLGTAYRVGETVRRLPGEPAPASQSRLSNYLNLAAQHAHFERSMAGASL